MSDTEYLSARAQQELRAAVEAADNRVRNVHLELADAYSFRLREAQALKQRSKLQLVRPLTQRIDQHA